MKLPRIGTLNRMVLEFIHQHPGIVGTEIARRLRPIDDEPEIYGYQRRTSSAIAALRKSGLVTDVAFRCSACGGATTRNTRNVELRVTTLAENLLGDAA